MPAVAATSTTYCIRRCGTHVEYAELELVRRDDGAQLEAAASSRPEEHAAGAAGLGGLPWMTMPLGDSTYQYPPLRLLAWPIAKPAAVSAT